MAEKLFPGEDPVGQDMRIGGTRLTVIGVFVKFGDDMMGMSMDESVLIPLAMARNFVNLHWSGTEMVVKGPDGGDVQELKADVGSIMRRLRRFGPRTEDNFAVNEMSILSNQLDNMFRRINFAGGGGLLGFFRSWWGLRRGEHHVRVGQGAHGADRDPEGVGGDPILSCSSLFSRQLSFRWRAVRSDCC